MGSHDVMISHDAPGAALVASAADADPVTRLVLGWLAGKRSEHTRTAYARDIGIIPRRRARRKSCCRPASARRSWRMETVTVRP